MFGKEYSTLAHYKSVAAAFEFRVRSQNLPWSHHEAVSYQPPPTRTKLLSEAEPESPDGGFQAVLHHPLRAGGVSRPRLEPHVAKCLRSFTPVRLTARDHFLIGCSRTPTTIGDGLDVAVLPCPGDRLSVC